jgi:hypothetical protein
MKKITTPPASNPATVVKTSATVVKPAEPAKVTRPVTTKEKVKPQLFDKENLKWMLAGLIVIAIGFILMAGGKSSSPNVFQDKDVYSFKRITIAPILIIAGFIIEIFAIMRKPRVNNVV